LPSDANTRRFVLGILLAFLPAAVIGAGLSKYIDALLETPLVVCITLILGGLILLCVDRLKLEPKYTDVTQIPPMLALKIGLCQCLAMIPGVSRSGATIVGSILLGTDKRSAAEFTFFIALPIMAGAFSYDLLKNHETILSSGIGWSIAIGFAAAFLTAVVVVRYLLDFITRHGFAFFAYWRIFVGAIGLWGILLFG
jgi:undecaprenyl-diphosphatase